MGVIARKPLIGIFLSVICRFGLRIAHDAAPCLEVVTSAFSERSFDISALVRASGAGGNADKCDRCPRPQTLVANAQQVVSQELSTVFLPILLLLWRVTGIMRSIEFPTSRLQIPIPGDLVGQPFLLWRLGNDRHTLLCAISIRLQQEALVAPLNNFNAGWLLRHHRIGFLSSV